MLEAKEIPSLLFYFLLSGIAIYVTSKLVGQVSKKIGEVIAK